MRSRHGERVPGRVGSFFVGKGSTMLVRFLNAGGEGFARDVSVSEGTSVDDFFEEQIGGDPEDYKIRVNRLPVTEDEILKEGDRVSVSPKNVKGQ